MLRVAKANKRGRTDQGWVNTYHSFSFADYDDSEMMGFRSLRAINEDLVTAGEGFSTHGHKDLEILSYIVEGAIEHKDSIGGEEILRPHQWQRMTAGSGIKHSEYNLSKTENLHFYQISILPYKNDLKADYEQKLFAPGDKSGKLKLVASGDSRDGSLKVNQDVSVFNAILKNDEEVFYDLAEKRFGWLQIVKGALELNGERLNVSDGAAISQEKLLKIKATRDETEFLFFDLA